MRDHWDKTMRQAALKMFIFLDATSYSFLGGANGENRVVFQKAQGEPSISISFDDLHKQVGMYEFQHNIAAQNSTKVVFKNKPQVL